MDVSLLIKQRLNELALDQKDLAAAIQVTESYISQLLARKKAPPAPGRTDLYNKIGVFLRLPPGELTKLADFQRQVELKKRVAETPEPFFRECRDLLLRKCAPEVRGEVRLIFEKEPFGEFERLVTQTLLDVAQGVVRGDSGRFGRTSVAQFLGSDVFHISLEGCVSFLDPIIDSWSIDVKTFRMDVVLNGGLVRGDGSAKTFEFAERSPEQPVAAGPGLDAFLRDKSLSGDATDEEVDFLKSLKFRKRQPSALYYYRELQNLRDPLHFSAPDVDSEPRTGTSF